MTMKTITKKAASTLMAAAMAVSMAVTANAEEACSHIHKTVISRTSVRNQIDTHDPHMSGASQLCIIYKVDTTTVWACNDCPATGTDTVTEIVHSINHS